MDCTICQELATAATGQATLSCGHVFHVGCIAGWLVADGPKTCPNCRNPLGPTEQLPGSVQEPEPLILTPGVQTQPLIEFQYAAPIASYIWDQVQKTGVHHLAAYSKVYTSLLTIQAAIRGHQAREIVRGIRASLRN